MEPAEIAAFGVVVIAFAAVSMRIERWPLTMPMVFVALGFTASATGLVDVSADEGAIAVLSEVTLAVILFSDAVRIDLRRLRRHLGVPLRLLGIGLPLTIVLGALFNSLLFPDLPFVQVALLAAILAPTDAALGSAVVEDEDVPARERLALNVESGVNDGLVVPAVAILTAAVIDEGRRSIDWAGFIAQQIGWGVVLGLVVGGGAIAVLRGANTRGWSDARFEQLATFAVPVIALFGAQALSGNSFIAAFVAGLAFGSFGSPDDIDGADLEGAETEASSDEALSTHFDAFTEDAAQLLAIGAFFVFGNVLLADALDEITLAVVACVLMTLTVGRMLPVWISLIGTPLPLVSRLFVGWFGPRGLASIVFGLLLLEETQSVEGVGEQLFAVIALTVVASIVLHGATAAPGAAAYARWVRRNEEMMDAAEEDMAMPRSRWARRPTAR
ncbi:MAG: cation:proton antiporter [Ilumatobacter sp.]|uniref:cation:proton antiporter n=1 Tax=Ilumatobacter sp. TaxID=1967498 RepID=UPI003C7325C7